MKKQLIVKLAAIALAATAQARDLPVPHGPDIDVRASACGLGPDHGQLGGELGQTGKAGMYNAYCNDLTDAEICLAIIKGSLNHEGEQSIWGTSEARVNFCLDEFKKNLLGE